VLPLSQEWIATATGIRLLYIPAGGLNLWSFIEIGLRTGTVGDNRFGADPLSADRDAAEIGALPAP